MQGQAWAGQAAGLGWAGGRHCALSKRSQQAHCKRASTVHVLTALSLDHCHPGCTPRRSSCTPICRRRHLRTSPPIPVPQRPPPNS